MDSKTGLIIQFSGIILIAMLSLFLTRTLKSAALKYWTIAWFSLSAALASLIFAFTFEAFDKIFLAFYFFGEYVFCFLLIAGCQNYASGETLPLRNLKTLIPFAILSLILSLSGKDINEIFNIHSFILATAFSFGFIAIKSVRRIRENSYGWYVMRVALALLAVSFYNYTLVFTLYLFSIDYILPSEFLSYNSVLDLVLEVLLGFGMVIVLLEEVRLDLEETNQKLKEAHDKLEAMAHVDSLTTAFNRHAFYGFLNKQENVISGCVGVFDIDDLKPINDRFGHVAGDMAIRSVVRSIRVLIRAEDLIFRWGGDEFFVIMISMNSEMARERMFELKNLLSNILIDGVNKRLSIGVSYGFSDFSNPAELESAIKHADSEMYRHKQENKIVEKTDEISLIPVPESMIERTAMIS